MKKSAFLTSSIVVLVLTNLGNVFQYVSQLVLGRMLTPTDYGIFNSVASLAVLITSLTVVVSFSTAREVIKAEHSGDSVAAVATELFKKFGTLGLGAAVLIALASPFLADYLALDSVLPILIYSLIVAAITVQAMLQGLLQGTRSYQAMSWAQVVLNGARLGFTVAVLYAGFTYNGALFAVLMAYVAVFIFYFLALRGQKGIRPVFGTNAVPRAKFRTICRQALPIAMLWGYLGMASNIDIPLVKHFFSDHETGVYSVAAVLGRIAFFLPMQLLFVLFPEVVKKSRERASAAGQVLLVCALTLGVCGLYCLVVFLFPETMIAELFGEKYVSGAGLLVVISVSMSLLSMLSIVLHYFAAKEENGRMVPAFVLFAATVAGVSLWFHESPMQVAVAFLVCFSTTLVVSLGLMYRQNRHRGFMPKGGLG